MAVSEGAMMAVADARLGKRRRDSKLQLKPDPEVDEYLNNFRHEPRDPGRQYLFIYIVLYIYIYIYIYIYSKWVLFRFLHVQYLH